MFSKDMRQDADATIMHWSTRPLFVNIRAIRESFGSAGPRFPTSSSSSLGALTSMWLTLLAPPLRSIWVVTSHEHNTSGLEMSAMDRQRRATSKELKPMRAVIAPRRENVARAEKQSLQASRWKPASMTLTAASQPPELQKPSSPMTHTSIPRPWAALKHAAPRAARRRMTRRNGRAPTASTVTPLHALPTARIMEPAAKAALTLALSSFSAGSSVSAPIRATGMA
mmetsp:Transcript_89018/g.249156  ORF Transcript_89018/g.249156 Transcript_89018/m.249156 type:complete len:226 (-) Transcript_89018:134-811(-)